MIKMVTDKKSGLEKPDFLIRKQYLIYCILVFYVGSVVFDPTNIQILKQFTTENCSILYVFSLFSTLQYRSSLQSDRNVYFP